jgi:hypothetical protein
MNQATLQVVLGGGLWSVILLMASAVLYRSRTKAETAKIINEAADIADEAANRRLVNLRNELYDAMDLSENRRLQINRMYTAIETMRVRFELHVLWDLRVKQVLDVVQAEMVGKGMTLPLTIGDPPSLDFSDIDFDFLSDRSNHGRTRP